MRGASSFAVRALVRLKAELRSAKVLGGLSAVPEPIRPCLLIISAASRWLLGSVVGISLLDTSYDL